ncbi:glutathione-disulfide reductase [Aliiroseovarius sp. F47248L]|uniref:glutathione-disulfide reductase n=1 Tax=Aliiroseovarius sp. F47248L TaxID=2926420 RepID=UPI001FF5E695|nr:glutathione-disulfide reductase [Aliiroseovarius sp. F47248L]MCK0138282.1 glutathione-disulfide reductase [Aliiroseovarius sp. F47248L]
MSGFDYDLFVIGGGSGGVRAGRVAAEGGAKVALAEEFRMGGTCVIRGCVPKKLMVFASQYGPAADAARAYGWQGNARGEFDWAGTFRPALHAELERLEGIYTKNLGNSGADIFHARATIKDAHTVVLSTGETFSAKHILVATGGRPFLPDTPGAHELGITSNEVFNLDDFPKRILIVGGGYIACEFACVFNGLGAHVAQWYRGAQILRGFDDEVRGFLAEHIRERGVDLHVGLEVERMERRATEDGDAIWVKGTDGREEMFDQVLFATGRVPNTDGLGLEEVGVKLGRGGEVVVDDYSQSTVPSIYAVGDVTNRIALTPVAIREGMAFVETVFNGNPTKPDHENVASAVFTQPEYGTVGLSEEDARTQEKIDVYSAAFRPMQKSFIGVNERVLFKLVVSQETQKVLGCHIVGEGAGEMIQMAAVAIKMGATKADFDRTVAVHPTMSEEIVLMKSPTRSD